MEKSYLPSIVMHICCAVGSWGSPNWVRGSIGGPRSGDSVRDKDGRRGSGSQEADASDLQKGSPRPGGRRYLWWSYAAFRLFSFPACKAPMQTSKLQSSPLGQQPLLGIPGRLGRDWGEKSSACVMARTLGVTKGKSGAAEQNKTGMSDKQKL